MRKLTDLMDLSGRVALVTGGSGHLGGAMCDALAEFGANIAVLDLDGDGCRQKAAYLTECFGIKTKAINTDLRNVDDVKEVPSSIGSVFGQLDILVNAAGFVGVPGLKGWSTPFEEQSTDIWNVAQDVNLLAPFVLTQACTPLLRLSSCASVVNVASIYGMVGPDLGLYGGAGVVPNPAAYAASKGGLLQLTRWLATTLAPDIRVNAITPGGILRGQPQDFIDRYEIRTPLGRLGREEDVKGAAVFLASDMSSYVTGHNLVVDGGWTAW